MVFGPDSDEEPKHFSRFRRTTSELQPGAWSKLAAIIAVTIAVVGLLAYQSVGKPPAAPSNEVVVYCAHDLPFVEPLIAEFEEQSGIQVTLVADTEANKSLGLTQRLMAERDRPAADVFWNNQLLGTIDLANKRLFQSHSELSNRTRFPEKFRDPNGLWTAFGARLRVWIIAEDSSVGDKLTGQPLPIHPEFCVADPLFGTTLTHAAVLWAEQKPEAFSNWFEALPGNGVRIVPGNSATRDLVANGICQFGWTDTDDFYGAVDRDAKVRLEPIRTATGKTIAIPNSVAIVSRCRHPQAARTFVDWLLSEEVELKLANGKAVQVPIGSVSVPDNLPPRVAELRPLVEESIDLRPFVDDRKRVLKYLGQQ